MIDLSKIQEAKKILKQYFGYDEFRQGQEQLIEAALNGQDVLGIMPTGAGKSLCFQIPALMMDGITLVISPLISLMKDQVGTLNQAGIHAAFLNSSLTQGQYHTALKYAMQGRYKIIYVAPERLETEGFINFALNSGVKISMLAVDEAHCVSQWGQDFRPSYLKILEFLKKLPYRPVLTAYTATATAEVRDDIMDILNLRDPFVLTTGFDRENLYYAVKRPRDKYRELLSYLKEKEEKMPGSSGIIYCLSRKNVEEVCYQLREDGFSVTRYHAGLSDEERKENQEDFIYDRKQIMVATNAFGMGIDKPDVRFVVHYNMPKNMESYYQEAGRAGRDGEPAECILYYAPVDNRTNRFLIENGEENEELDAITKQIVMERDWERLRQMTFYCYTKECLRHYILNYFGEQTSGYCGNCLNCLTEFETVDATMEAKAIIDCIRNCYRDFGLSTIVDILKGSKSQKVLSRHLDENSKYGVLAAESIARIRQIINEMLVYGYLEMTDDEYPVLSVADITKIDDNWKFEIKIPKEVEKEKEERKIQTKKRKKAGAVAALAEGDTDLFEALRALRRTIASEQKIPPYMVFSDKTLVHMSTMKPSNDEEMLEVNGVGEHKLQKYGERFLNEIQKYK